MALDDSDPGRALRGLLREPTLKPHEIARALDSMSHVERVRAIRATSRADQRRLYRAVEGARALGMSDVVPPQMPALAPVRHHGKNTLPAFTWFEKRFCRPADADPHQPDRLWGYNEQSLRWLTGPGYFVLRPAPRPGELVVDYTCVPGERPAAWPEIRPNERGLSRFVYGFMVDTLRGVSTHVSIGSAARHGRDIGSWFLLCRED